MDVTATSQRNAKRFGRFGGKPFVPRRQPVVPSPAQREKPSLAGAQEPPSLQKCANCLKTCHAAVDSRLPKVEKRNDPGPIGFIGMFDLGEPVGRTGSERKKEQVTDAEGIEQQLLQVRGV